jgi:hypothetical protein
MSNRTVLCGMALTAILSLNLGQAQQPGPSKFQLAGRGGSVEYPRGWSPHNYANVRELILGTPEKLAQMSADEREEVPRIEFNVIQCADHAEALHRLRVISAERNNRPTYLTIGGWPALQRRSLIPKFSEGPEAGKADKEQIMLVTTAIAAGNTLIRIDGSAPEDAPEQIFVAMETVGKSLHPAVAGESTATGHEVQQLRNSPVLRTPTGPPPGGAASLHTPEPIKTEPQTLQAKSVTERRSGAPADAIDLGNANLQIGSEPEITVSADGKNIVAAQGCSFRNSTDSGANFFNGGGSPGNCTGGDSSVAWGKNGNFYWAVIGSNTATCPVVVPAKPNCNNTQQMNRSTNNGANFSFLANVIDCQATAGCGFGNVPDQEHIAADRFNDGAAGKDQVYLAFRKGGGGGYGLHCSTDSGATWSAVKFITGGGIDFPRITVAQNGTVYVVTNNGNNINLDSFSSCNSGLAQNLNQVSIASGINGVPCPVPGLDRCNDGNHLASHTVSVDDTDATHLFASYAVNTVAPNPTNAPPTTLGSENVMVQDSTNSGANWGSAVQLNSSTNGRRFLPWSCALEGTVYVSWYDRRASSTGSNDLTDYWAGSAKRSGGTLTAGSDFRINNASDPQCAPGWPCQTRSSNDSESCNTQPQLAGICGHNPIVNTDSKTPCDFSSTTCPMGESCQTGGGCPKYGDYNGNACAFGRLYTVWNSATNQAGFAPPTGGNINLFFSSTLEHKPPIAKCKNVTVNTGPTDTTCTAPASIDDGSNDPDGDTITLSQSPAGPYPKGTTNNVVLTVTDKFGATATCTANVTVVDNTPPKAVCPAQYVKSADASCQATIPNVLPDVTITDNCPGPFSSSQNPLAGTVETGVSTTNIHVSVQDNAGNPASCDTSLKIIDTTAPTVTSSVSTSMLWPDNHDMINIGLTATAKDNCDPNPVLAVKAIYSTEGDQGPGADSNFSPDALNIGFSSLRERSERGGGDQRVYVNVVRATDVSNNVGYSCTTTFVPSSQSKNAVASAQAAAAAAQLSCNTNSGAAPAGFVQNGVGPVVGPKQ